ncbi:hypothetical protein QW060_23455 [Myroides ceti]|uniref:Uncharacterized protein n=1 Tax=Paenimyroides ceti TaxID=395087 RepID=A0ABT8D0R8_9FLAO|nr:hypothetical protein [Paenimyroides ceti]MDN3709876.1 hypothetical protein [Paenimyroides ceti]
MKNPFMVPKGEVSKLPELSIVVFKFKKINSAFVVIGGALLGYLFNLI